MLMVSILVSYWMGWECNCYLRYNFLTSVSILVSYWMGWEWKSPNSKSYFCHSFNPSFLLDGLGILFHFLEPQFHFQFQS